MPAEVATVHAVAVHAVAAATSSIELVKAVWTKEDCRLQRVSCDDFLDAPNPASRKDSWPQWNQPDICIWPRQVPA